MIYLDFTSDLCAVFLTCGPEDADVLGGSVAGERLEDDYDGAYALIGDPWGDDASDADNDANADYWRKTVIREIEAAGLAWQEI